MSEELDLALRRLKTSADATVHYARLGEYAAALDCLQDLERYREMLREELYRAARNRTAGTYRRP